MLTCNLVAADPNLLEMVNKLKAENMRLREENIRLQNSMSNQDRNYELEIARIKQQSLKIITEKEKEFEKTIERMDYDFKEKLNELKKYKFLLKIFDVWVKMFQIYLNLALIR